MHDGGCFQWQVEGSRKLLQVHVIVPTQSLFNWETLLQIETQARPKMHVKQKADTSGGGTM
jgi:hypothetical protein